MNGPGDDEYDYEPELPPLEVYEEHRPPPDPTPEDRPSGSPPPGQEAALADGQRATDAGNARRLARLIDRDVTGRDADGLARWVAAWGKWLVYEAGAWRVDHQDARITGQAKAVGQDLFTRTVTLTGDARDLMFKWAKRSESAAAIASMVRLSRDLVLVDHTQLDQQQFRLNCLNGTVDLATGQLLDHNPDDFFTSQAPVVYDPDAACPLFDECLATWQPDADVRDYLQLVAGAGATGAPTEVVIVNLGPGGNGKGKFWGALQDVLGPDYVVVPHKSLIVVQRHEQHDTVKARLFGARLAIAGETEAGDRLDEAKLKELTGGDLLEARRMREDPWKFRPTHTLVLHTNYRPKVSGDDEGIWRRIQLVPWEAVIPVDQQDPQLAEKLRDEAPGILNWIIAGAQAFLAAGNRLQPPEQVRAATQEYRDSEDHVGRFFADCCVDGHGDQTLTVSAKLLRDAYEAWCDEVGERVRSAKAVGASLTKRGFDSHKAGQANTVHWFGFTLLERDTDDGDPGPTEPEQTYLVDPDDPADPGNPDF